MKTKIIITKKVNINFVKLYHLVKKVGINKIIINILLKHIFVYEKNIINKNNYI